MIWMVITACMVNNLNACKDYNVTLEMESVQQCQSQDQIILVDFIGTHPNLAIKEYHCTIAGTEAKL